MIFDTDTYADFCIGGVDPGAKGGIVILNLITGGIEESFSFSQKKYRSWKDQLSAISGLFLNVRAYFLEDLGIQPASSQDGNISIAKLNRHYGFLQCAIMSIVYPFQPDLFKVTPSVWQTRMNCCTKGDKRVTLEKAKQLFNNHKCITHSTADAALIAAYGRIVLAQKLSDGSYRI